MRAISPEAFVEAWQKGQGSPTRVALLLGINERAVYARRERMEKQGVFLPTIASAPGGVRDYAAPARNYAQRIKVDLPDGVAVVFSDAHWWPGLPLTAAHSALLRLCRTCLLYTSRRG